MSRRFPRLVAASAALVALLGLMLWAPFSEASMAGSAATSLRSTAAPKPTIVLVHGAFGDASGWSSEIRQLSRLGYPVIAPANPLRGLISDATYIHSVLATIDGPVILVGHSYGGAVITNAANDAPNVKALVFISAFLPRQGEAAADFTNPDNYPGSLLNGPHALLLRPITNVTINKADQDVYINPTEFRSIFAGDQSATKASVLGAEQRPVTLSAYTEQSGPAAWRNLPSWDLISLDDKAIPPTAQKFMAARAHAHTVAIHSAHDSLISHPHAVTDLIVCAARGVS